MRILIVFGLMAGFLAIPSEAAADGETVCADAVQGQVSWDYQGSNRWQQVNIDRLCADAEDSTEPARCFQSVMHTGINHGAGDRWQWQNALELCSGSRDHRTSIRCFQEKIAAGRQSAEAITSCRWDVSATATGKINVAAILAKKNQQMQPVVVVGKEITLPTVTSRLRFLFSTGEDDLRQSSGLYVGVVGIDGEYLTGGTIPYGIWGDRRIEHGVRTEFIWERVKGGGYSDLRQRDFAIWAPRSRHEVPIDLRKTVSVDEIREVMIYLMQDRCPGCTSDNWDMVTVHVYADIPGADEDMLLFRTAGERPLRFTDSWPILALDRAPPGAASATEWRK